MKCKSCELEINPQWAHAIDMNVCPFCGKHIMDNELKVLFGTLRETMEKLKDHGTELDDWLLSNHSYIKTNSEKLIDYLPSEMLHGLKKAQDDQNFQERKKFTVKVKTDTGEEEVPAETLQSEAQTSEFFRRAEVIRTPSAKRPSTGPSQSLGEKTEHFKHVVQQIKRAGTRSLTVQDDGGGLPPGMLEDADPEAVAEFQQMISGGEGISSALTTNTGDDISDHILMANQAIAAKRGGSNSNNADLLKLQQMQERRNSSAQNFESGANRGKGGFSRSG